MSGDVILIQPKLICKHKKPEKDLLAPQKILNHRNPWVFILRLRNDLTCQEGQREQFLMVDEIGLRAEVFSNRTQDVCASIRVQRIVLLDSKERSSCEN
jgi:hypothetical protein